MSRVGLLATLALLSLLAAGLAAAPAQAASPHTRLDLLKVRAATAPYHWVGNAEAAGYVSTEECASSPEGGMGIHYVNFDLIADPALEPTQPEILIYEPTRHGPRLVAVEYATIDADQDLGTDQDRPTLFGVPFDGPMLGHGPGEPIHYDLHAWVWKHNPSGTFAQWNPRVHC